MTKIQLALVGIVSLSALIGTASAGAASIQAENTDYCLDPRGDSAQGSAVILRHCGALQLDQQWSLHGNVIEGHANNNTCLDVSGGTQAAGGTPVIIYNCHGGVNQRWTYVGGALRSFGGSDLCLDVSGANFYDGAPVQIWECNGGNAQRWRIE